MFSFPLLTFFILFFLRLPAAFFSLSLFFLFNFCGYYTTSSQLLRSNSQHYVGLHHEKLRIEQEWPGKKLRPSRAVVAGLFASLDAKAPESPLLRVTCNVLDVHEGGLAPFIGCVCNAVVLQDVGSIACCLEAGRYQYTSTEDGFVFIVERYQSTVDIKAIPLLQIASSSMNASSVEVLGIQALTGTDEDEDDSEMDEIGSKMIRLGTTTLRKEEGEENVRIRAKKKLKKKKEKR